MRHVAMCAVALGVVFACGLAIAQEDAPPPNYEHLKGLECFVGDWIGKGEWPEDGREFAGKKFTARTSVKWIVDKNVQEWKWTYRIGGNVVAQGGSFMYYDASTKQVKSFCVGLLGGHWQEVWKEDGGKWVAKGTGVTPKGEKTSGKGSFAVVDGKMVIEFTEGMIAEEKQPDSVTEFEQMKPRAKKKR